MSIIRPSSSRLATPRPRAARPSAPAPARNRVLAGDVLALGRREAAPLALGELAWLVGRWHGRFGGDVETVWTPASAGSMTASMKIHAGGRVLMLQLGHLRETAEGLEFRFRHFGPGLEPFEREPVTMRLVEHDVAAGRLVFENPVHDRPKRTIFTRLGADGMHVRSELGSGTQQEIHELELVRQR